MIENVFERYLIEICSLRFRVKLDHEMGEANQE